MDWDKLRWFVLFVIFYSEVFIISITFEGLFDITDGAEKVAHGKVTLLNDSERQVPYYFENIRNYDKYNIAPDNDIFELDASDFYKMYRLRGYEFGPHFRGVHKACNSGRSSTLAWRNNWITFIDSFLQTHILFENTFSLCLPIRLERFRIDPLCHFASIYSEGELQLVDAIMNYKTKGGIAGGMESYGLVYQTMSARNMLNQSVIMEWNEFAPYFNACCLDEFLGTRDQLLKYNEDCFEISKAILPLISDQLLKTNSFCQMHLVDIPYAQSKVESTEFSLLQFLQNLTNEFNGICKLDASFWTSVAHMYLRCADVDPLLNFAWNYPIFVDVLDICLQNLPFYNFEITAIEPISHVAIKNVQSLIKTHPGISCHCSLMGKNTKRLMENDTSSYDLNVNEVSNILSEEVEESQHILILDRVVHKQKDPVKFLATVRRMLVTNGFAIVCETTSNFETSQIVDIFETIVVGSTTTGIESDDFISTFYTHNELLEIFEEAGFLTVAYRGHSLMTSVYVIRKKHANSMQSILFNREDYSGFQWIEALQQKIEHYAAAPPEHTIVLVANQKNDFGFIGLMQCIKLEYGKKNRIRLVGLDCDENNSGQVNFSGINDPEISKQIQSDLVINLFRNGEWGTMRRMLFTKDELTPMVQTQQAVLTTLTSGNLSSLAWIASNFEELETKASTLENYQLISVYYAPLNFRDIMIASGKLNGNIFTKTNNATDISLLGIEFAGRCTKTGRRLMGILPSGQGFSQNVLVHEAYCVDIPDNWTMKDAATVPVAYMTVFYALIVRGNIQKGESILIHSAAGGVGLAAIYVALSFKCKIFLTCGTDIKKEFLLGTFPTINEDCVFSSRNTEFQVQIMNKTGGKGVDLVLNSLSESLLQASVQCLAKNGRFLEIGKYDFTVNNKLSMDLFSKNASFHGIVLESLWHESDAWAQVSKGLYEGLISGIVQPLPITLFDANSAIDAFRFMAQGKHVGKVVLQIRKEEVDCDCLPKPTIISALQKNYFHPDHVYILAGGLGGLGLELMQWLIGRGASKLVLTSRYGAKTGYQKRCVNYWRKKGITIKISTLNITKLEETYQLINEAQLTGPIGGVFNLCMAIGDCLFENQTAANFEDLCAPKVTGTENLDTVTRQLCDTNLKWFVFFSSIAASKGNIGQTAYAYANLAGEYIVASRRKCGLPGINIQFGGIADVGILVKSTEDNKKHLNGNALQRLASVLHSFDLLLTMNKCSAASYVCADVNAAVVFENQDAVEAVAKILGLQDIKQIDHDELLSNMGIDSLMAVQVKQFLEQTYDIYMSTKELKLLTLNKLRLVTKQAKSNEKKKDKNLHDDVNNG